MALWMGISIVQNESQKIIFLVLAWAMAIIGFCLFFKYGHPNVLFTNLDQAPFFRK